MKGHYQPAGMVGMVNWAWILMIGLAALIMQLEVTHINVWSVTLLFVFLITLTIAILRRKIIVDKQYIHLTQLFSASRLSVRLSEVEHVQFTRHGVLFDYNDDAYNILLSTKMRQLLKEKLGEQDDK
ncbi:hypothetical protein H9L19_06565 [Weissella diestrammenae]|uniref:Pore-forming protein n=1 Tax=Weissella diestrammenae TaxID=1162633 RepID=A0A7G9T4L6_9LACO|nr:EbsA family protein [Weissella diestrammenae]MCM0582068.1 hypothetical protein [Weissella diestrammenae]QNN75041.1 hypothetical protein H9L19_06565 [Weissella diestrammenae]